MPAEVPDGRLRLRGRWGGHLGEQDQDIVRRLERRQPTPARLRGARELPGVERNRRLRIDGVQMQMMEAWRREHVSPSFLKAMESIPVRSRDRTKAETIVASSTCRRRMRLPTRAHTRRYPTLLHPTTRVQNAWYDSVQRQAPGRPTVYRMTPAISQVLLIGQHLT